MTDSRKPPSAPEDETERTPVGAPGTRPAVEARERGSHGDGDAARAQEPAFRNDGDGARAQEPASQTDGDGARAREPASQTDGDGARAQEDFGVPELQESAAGFPVVGVGASAGGLEALETFLSRLPRTGMAFVVIQHLAPSKESHLPAILSRSTRLPVMPATDGVVVEPDHVYVIPPGVNLAMFQGKLHLMDVPTAP